MDQKLSSFVFPFGVTWLMFRAVVISGFALVISVSGGNELLVLLAQVEHREVVVVLKVDKTGSRLLQELVLQPGLLSMAADRKSVV